MKSSIIKSKIISTIECILPDSKDLRDILAKIYFKLIQLQYIIKSEEFDKFSGVNK